VFSAATLSKQKPLKTRRPNVSLRFADPCLIKTVLKGRKNATTPLVPDETLLFVRQSRTIQAICCTIALWSKPMHTQKRTFSGHKLIYNEIKRWGQSFWNIFVFSCSCHGNQNPFVSGGTSSISVSAVIGQLGTRERDTDNYLIKTELRGTRLQMTYLSYSRDRLR